MATPAWQTRPSQPPVGMQQAAVGGLQSHWGAPGTGASPAQGLPRPPYGPPSGPPGTAYGQTATPLSVDKGSNQANSGSGGGPLPPPTIPSSSASGILQSYPQPPTMQALQSYGPPMGPFPGDNRWQQPPAPGSTPVPPLPPVAPRLVPDGTHAGIPRPAVSPLGTPTPAGSQSVTVVSGPPGRPSPYHQYPSGPGPGPGLGPAPPPVGPWMPPPQQAGPLQQRPPFPIYPSNFQPTFPGPLHAIHGTGGIGPPGGPYGRDLSITKGVLSPSASGWGQQRAPPKFPPPSEDSSAPSNGKQTVTEAARAKTADSAEDKGLSENSSDASKIELTELPDVWTAHKTADGTVYYYNSIKGQSTYDKPPDYKGEVEKVTAKTTPVSWERLNGSDWALVTTNDEKKYYYNTKSQATSWQVPPEVWEQRKKQLEESAAKAALEVVAAPGTAAEKSPVSFSLNVPAAATGGREAVGHRAIVTNSALDLIKKKLQDPGVPITSSPSPPVTGATPGDIQDFTGLKGDNAKDKIKGSTVDAVSSESSSESDDEDPGPTKEERVGQFKEMLREKGIAPFSKWEKELPKIIFDVRFKAIPSHTERRAIFEHYVRTRADEERKEKRAAQKAAVEGFKQLLEEATKEITCLTTFDQFASTWGQDARFEALDRKDQEALLNERVLPLRKAEEERVKAEHAVAVGGFRAMLLERSDIITTTRWSKVRESLRSDSRYINVKREDRENLFNAYVAELVFAEQEAERAAKAKRDEEEKLKEKEREMRKRKEREELEMERVRAKARRKDAVNAYQALLTEKIKDPEASWTEARPKLEKDPLGRATLPELEPADRERFFREHTNEVFERCVRDYRLLLADVITVDAASKDSDDGKQILTSWTEAKKILKLDPRYTKMPRRDRELWWRRYADDVQRRMKLAASKTPSKGDKVASGNGAKSGASVDASRQSPGLRRHSGRR